MKHEHSLEVKVSPELQEVIDTVHDGFLDYQNMCMLTLGIVIGAVGMRILSKPTVQVVVKAPEGS